MPENTSDTLYFTAQPFWQWGIQENPVAEVDTGIPFDSIHRPREVKDTVFRQSMFKKHTLQVQGNELTPRYNNSEPAWVFVSLLLLTGLIALYLHLRKIKLFSLLKALVDRRAMDRIVRDNNLNHSLTILPMGILLVAAVCLPVHRVALSGTGFWGYLLLTVGISLLYILRNGILRLLGNTFENRQGVIIYITNNYFFHLLESIVVTALLFPLFYLPDAQTTMLSILVGFLVIAFAIRFFRGIKVFLTLPNSSSFYLFYYLCIVELIPILVLIKWIIYNNSAS